MNNLSSSQWRPLPPSGDYLGLYNPIPTSASQSQQLRRSIKKTPPFIETPSAAVKPSYDYRDRSPGVLYDQPNGDFNRPRALTRQQHQQQFSVSNNGFNDNGNNYEFSANRAKNSYYPTYDRSVSLQDHSHTMVNGFGRQLPTSSSSSLSPSSNYNDYNFNGNDFRSAPTYNDSQQQQQQQQQRGSPMKIGTWNAVTSNSSSSTSSSFPPVMNFEIGTFNSGPITKGDFPTSNNGAATNRGNNEQTSGPGTRETGIIEKLLHSYGFIQCCERQARLFFHFSQFDGNIEHLKIGDPVEFEMTYDRRTGKPIASVVSKIAPDVVMSEERVIGTVTTETRIDPDTGNPTQGRISYENRGECFFLPFSMADVEGNVTITSGDKVSFQMATMQRSGNLVARTIRLENPAAPVKYKGVVNSIKESFGFIERADVVKEIFFHFSESGSDVIALGDDVEFTIQTRSSKEVACNITKLPAGTVVFEDVGTEYFTGQVLKPIDRSVNADGTARETDPLPGRVKYRGQDRSEVEVPFGEKDQLGDFTLRHGDWVKFFIAVDRRDKLQRATKIELMDESFRVSDERREQGVIQSIMDGYGYLTCADRDAKMFFRFSECLDVNKVPTVGDECEFTVAQDLGSTSSASVILVATRIKHLTEGTIFFDMVIHRNVAGRVEIVASVAPDAEKDKESCGKIVYELNGALLDIPFYAKDCNTRRMPRKSDPVTFDINQLKSTKETNAVNVRLSRGEDDKDDSASVKRHGYIAAVKDGFGFIETSDMDKEIFFHFSNVEGKVEKLEVGTEVEYRLASGGAKDKKISGEKVRILNRGAVAQIPAKEELLDGKIVRTLRSVNPDQEKYSGLIQVKSEDGNVIAEYEYGIASLLNKKELLQIRDPVQFQVSACGNFAVNVRATRVKLRASVEAVKGQFGFLSHEVEEGKKLFFHMSEVEGGDVLRQGDEVEFVIFTNGRTGKHSACCVKKLGSVKRPDRLVNLFKGLNLDKANGGPKVVAIRQPRGPDGTSGFKSRSTLAAIALLDEMEANGRKK